MAGAKRFQFAGGRYAQTSVREAPVGLRGNGAKVGQQERCRQGGRGNAFGDAFGQPDGGEGRGKATDARAPLRRR